MTPNIATRPLEDLTPADVPILVTELPGELSRSMFEREARYTSPGGSAVHTLSQLVLQEAYGALLKDVDGNVLIDFGMGMIGVSTGHRHPVVMRAISRAMDRYLHVYDMTTPERVELYEYMAEILPANLGRFQMYNGGAETVEAALRLAKSGTKKHEFISLYRGFHGKTLASMSLLGLPGKKGYGPLPGGYFQTPNAYCYRCPLGLKYPSCGVACADMISEVYEQQSTGDVAAVIVEPIQAAGGMIVPPPEFLPKIEAFCKKQGLVLIADEIFTGGGRTGKMWAFEHSGVQPNIVTMGKGTGSGFPVGLLAAEDGLVQNWPWNQPNGSSTTFGGNVVAAAAMLATLKVIGDEGMVENSARVGLIMKERFLEMQKKFDFIGDVRGEGLMIGLETVRDRSTKEPLPAELCAELFRQIMRRGVLIPSVAHVMRIVPPLMISEALAVKGLDLMEDAFEAFQRSAHLNGA
jgi:4-aminobutyrate aminotransferase / (S)-3-amino-2-methylpropionate transaminase / 5-aminovalerate transaminase